MAELVNCPNCGKLYVKALRSVCDVCAREVENKFDIVYKFIRRRENRKATLDEVVEGTEVEKDMIVRFIREGRLHVSQFPNLGYPCSKCGKNIKEGKLCGDCTDGFSRDLEAGDRQKAYEKRKEDREKAKYQTYSSMSDRFNRNR
ncbi:TIGR03826 family flagellar region protein [Salipaludibacillus sp. CF4.18]|uniref:TIGR03826 family flagellar region protein n=1 Tax=Salipaludibacillus sp. CF4.18 TaxID=3373081 RepID=UPI003EE5EFCD